MPSLPPAKVRAVRNMIPALFSLITLLGCQEEVPEFCLERADDIDCDGVPDDQDRCPASPMGDPTDRSGCTEGQAAGCSVTAVEPADNERLESPARFRWAGDCDVYLLQFSDDPSFPVAATRTGVRTTAIEVVAPGSEQYWRVVGGLQGSSAGALTPPREVRRWK